MKRILPIGLAVYAVFALLDIFLIEYPGDPVWAYVPGFFALLGLIGSMFLILFAKWLGHHWLQRPPDYYEQKKDDDE